MTQRHWPIGVLIVLAFAVLGCGLAPDKPITSPHAVVVVKPQEGGGVSYLFAANKYLGKVYRVNLYTLAIDEITVGRKPENIAASPDGYLVAVANNADKSITVIRAATLAKKTVVTGRRPSDIGFSPDGNWLGVANSENETVSLIDAHSGKLWNNIWVGGGPAALAFDPTSRFMAVACYDEDAVKIVSVQEKKVVTAWSNSQVINRPQAVIFSNGAIRGETLLFVGCHEDPYVENGGSYAESIAVLHLSPTWADDPEEYTPQMQIIRAGPNPRGFLWNHAGDKLLAINHVFEDWDSNYNVDTLSLIDVSGAIAEEQRFVTGHNPVAAALAPEEDVVAVANKGGASITIVDLTDNSSFDVSTIARPFAVAFTPSGHKVIVVHDSALMPLSVVDLASGSSRVVYDSLSMNDWIE